MVKHIKLYVRREISRLIDCRAGVAAVEAAMIMPFLIIFLFGSIEFSRSLYIQSELERAVNLTTRYVMLNPEQTEAQFKTELTSKLDTVDSGNIVAITATRGTNADGNNTVQLTVTYSFQFLIPFMTQDPIQLSATQTIVTS